MNAESCDVACSLVSRSYISQGQQALARRHKRVKALLSSRRMPQEGWDDASIEAFIQDLALMDSNNFLDNVGVGEREARVACGLVSRRHYHLAHGIGRSGDIAAEQPKAAGSSLLAKLTNLLAADALSHAGLHDLGPVTVLPLATGMAMTVSLLALRPSRPPAARYVLWSRVDQKTCLKAITAACCTPLVVELKREGDALVTDMQALESKLHEVGADNVVAVVTTTGCFAPRAPDDVVAVARVCEAAGVPHVINNAYGVQSAAICAQITSAWRKGRVDAIVQSTDKNFMVPVGGALVAAPRARPALVDSVNKMYPGRAAVTAHLDLLMTLLHWGVRGWKQELSRREELVPYLTARLQEVGARHGERVLHTPQNPISFALTLDSLAAAAAAAVQDPTADNQSSSAAASKVPEHAAGADTSASSSSSSGGRPGVDGRPVAVPPAEAPGPAAAGASPGAEGPGGSGATEAAGAGPAAEHTQPTAKAKGAAKGSKAQALNPSFFGSMLWARCISGTRVVPTGKKQNVAGIDFVGYGAHHYAYPHVYMTAAAAIGTTREDVDEFVSRLGKCFEEFHKKKQARDLL
mmetsp:Transcript_38719/g.86114  ORF Transcript_38719/g.86114 Transcript_38719/m.86114 type:complete len:580 (+) Transcript_38719:110-1849(+)